MRSIFYSILILLFPSMLLAQTGGSASASVYEIAFDSALAKLNKSQLAIYNGREYYPYFLKQDSKYVVTSVTVAGSRPGEHPFFLSDEFRAEEIEFNGVVYPSVLLTFDICRSEVVVLNPKRKAIILPTANVQKFEYSGHQFRLITNVKDLKNDLYETLYWSDSTILCVKQRKNQTELWRMISDYYIILNNQAYPVSSLSTKSVGVKATLLRILADREDQMRAFIREKKLKFSKTKKEQSLIKAVEYYASLKTH